MISIAQIRIDNNAKMNFDSKYIANDIFPIAINEPSEDISFYTILFCCHQDIRDQYMYLQVPINMDEDTIKIIKKRNFFINNIKSDDTAYKEFINMTNNMRIENLFITDFDYIKLKDTTYYKFQSVRQIGQSIYLRREIQIPRWTWIQLKLFFDDLFFDINWNSRYFLESNWSKTYWIKVDHFNYNAATRKKFKSVPMIINHYIIGCGPSEYNINWITPDKYTDRKLKKSLHSKIYLAEYSHHPSVTHKVYDETDGTMYIILPTDDKCVVLKIEKDILKDTNFLDIYNNVYE